MPCPESRCAAGGLGRDPHGKVWYERNGLREVAKTIADGQVDYMLELTKAGYRILAILGVEFSPACAVNYLNRGPIITKDRGILVEELQRGLRERKLNIPFIGVNQRALKKLARQLNEMISLENDADAPKEKACTDKVQLVQKVGTKDKFVPLTSSAV